MGGALDTPPLQTHPILFQKILTWLHICTQKESGCGLTFGIFKYQKESSNIWMRSSSFFIRFRLEAVPVRLKDVEGCWRPFLLGWGPLKNM